MMDETNGPGGQVGGDGGETAAVPEAAGAPQSAGGTEPSEEAPGDGRSRMESRQAEWMRQLQTMIDEVATQAAPVIRDVAAKASELAQRAAEAAAPYAARAADVTADVATAAAQKSREVAADIRAAEQRRTAAAAGSPELGAYGAGEAGEGGAEPPRSDEGGAI